MAEFVPASELSAAFYAQVVEPQLRGVPHSAALLGWGSDVLGYDTFRSTDHGWGPRLQVFTSAVGVKLELPDAFGGHAVRFGWDAVEPRVWVEVLPLSTWLAAQLGVDACIDFTVLDWVLTPQQKLLGIVGGAVFEDSTGQLSAVRNKLSWYPDAAWRWMLACQWHRLAQEEAFVARTSEVGDRTGSVVTAARQVRDLMRLALLQNRRYAPYQKWLGTAFAQLPHSDALPGLLAAAVHGDQTALGEAYRVLAIRQNASALTPPLSTEVGNYHDRPACVIMADRFCDALIETITDPVVRALPLIGSVDQVVDNTDVLTDPSRCRDLQVLYGAAAKSSGPVSENGWNQHAHPVPKSSGSGFRDVD